MVGIHSATAEIGRGKKEEERRRKKKKPQDENIMSVFATQGGHKYNGLPYSIRRPKIP